MRKPYDVTRPKNWLQRIAALHAVILTTHRRINPLTFLLEEPLEIFIGSYSDCVKVANIANRAFIYGFREGKESSDNYWNP